MHSQSGIDVEWAHARCQALVNCEQAVCRSLFKEQLHEQLYEIHKCALSEEFRRYWSTIVDSYRLSYWNLWDCGSSTIGRITLCQYESPVNTIQLLGSCLLISAWVLPLELYRLSSTIKHRLPKEHQSLPRNQSIMQCERIAAIRSLHRKRTMNLRLI